MKWQISNLQTRLYLVTAIILLVGLVSAILIYLAAEKTSDRFLGYEVAGENVYPLAPEDSKKYLHDLELYGGKTNVLVNEIMHWFDELWHGKSLAFTVACISTFISLAVFFVAYHLPSDVKYNTPDEKSGRR